MPARMSQLAGRDRLRGLRREHQAAGAIMAVERERFAALSDDGAKAIAVSADNLFPTPPELARRVIELAEIEPHHNVLEPSAGTGNLVRAVYDAEPAARVYVVEIEPAVYAVVRPLAMDGRCGDFLTMDGEIGAFDRIVMNPPFRRGADVKHIQHAASKLADGGRLVAICANGPRQREALEPLASEWHDLPAGSFKSEGTNVNAAIVVIEN